MHKFADRVKESTTTTGTGAYSLAGAVTGFSAFSAAFVTGNTVYYCCEDGLNWEVGYGVLTSGSPWTLSRTAILSSSNAGAAVNWGAGSKSIFHTVPAGRVRGDEGMLFTKATIDLDVAVDASHNALSAGPITIASGKTVTIATGARWVIL